MPKGSRKARGDLATVTVTFDVPLDFAFAWCTDYTPEDAALEGESYVRKVIDRSGRQVIFEDLEETESGWIWARDIVTLRPPNRWHLVSSGSHRDVTGDYLLTKLPGDRTKFELRWWRQPHGPGKKVPRAQREKETTKAWNKFAAAMREDFEKTKSR